MYIILIFGANTMLNTQEISRYQRHLALPEFGVAGQNKLKSARVLVIGAGGLGCPALLYLTAAGIGELGIVDFDVVEESNLQRQVLYHQQDIGQKKADVAAHRLSQQNPWVKINTYPTTLNRKNALAILEHYDVVIDGTDNFNTRFLINDACDLLDKPLIYGAIHKFEGQVSVLNHTLNGIKGPTYRCLFPSPPTDMPNCSEVGVLGVLPGIIGTLQASEAIKVITGVGIPLSGKLFILNALNMHSSTLMVKRDPNCALDLPKNKADFEAMPEDLFCSPDKPKNNVSAQELYDLIDQKQNWLLLDVRESFEVPKMTVFDVLKIPLSSLPDSIDSIPKEKKIIVFCKSGVRSKKAIDILAKHLEGTHLYNLEGGIDQWTAYCEKTT